MRRSSGFVIGIVLALGACGDNIKTETSDGPPPNPDGPPPADAAPDAMPPTPATRAMTVAFTDVTVLGDGATTVGGVRGGSSSLVFSDLTMNGGTLVAGTQPIGGCVVTEFSPTALPNPGLNAGMITIANEPPGETPATGLLKTVGSCAFTGAATGYRCISHSSASAAVNATNPPTPPGVIAYTVPGETFPTGGRLVGSYLNVNGFTDTSFNSGPSAFPIVSQTGTTTLAVVNPNGEMGTMETAATASYNVINAFAPVPGAGAAANFFGMGDVRITKPASGNWPALDLVIGLVGEGFALDSDSDDPSALPATATGDLVFACDGPDNMPNTGDDTCGDTQSATTVRAIIISGRATQKPVPPPSLTAPDFLMPTEIPGTDTWREWQCAYLLSRSATLTQEALTAILGQEVSPPEFIPTRIEMRVLFVAGAILNGPNPEDNMTGRVLVGHGIVGHTDP
jgi:hypothetical protein